MGVVVFDTEALTAFGRNRVLRLMVDAILRDSDTEVLVPAVLLAEAISGRPRDDVTTFRTLRRFGTVVTTEDVARHAGALRARTGDGRHPPSAIDAIVAAHAASIRDEGCVVLTSDVDDLTRLLQAHPDIDVQPVPS